MVPRLVVHSSNISGRNNSCLNKLILFSALRYVAIKICKFSNRLSCIKCRTFCVEYLVFQDRWSLIVVVS